MAFLCIISCISYSAPSIKFCSYNFILNKVPNNSDAMCVANIVLNEVPSNNNAMRIANYVHWTTIISQQFSMVASYIMIKQKKLTYRRQGIATQKQERFMQMEINFILGKNGGHMPSNLGGRSIRAVRLWLRINYNIA